MVRLFIAALLLLPIVGSGQVSPGGYDMYPKETLDWIMDRNIRVSESFDFLSLRMEAVLRQHPRGVHGVADLDTIQRGTTKATLQVPTAWGDADGTFDILNIGAMLGRQNGDSGWRGFVVFNGMKLGLIQHIGDLYPGHPELNSLIEWNIYDLLVGAQFNYKGLRITAGDLVRSRVSITNDIYHIDADKQEGVTTVSHSLFLKVDYKRLLARLVSDGLGISEAGLMYVLALPGRILGNFAPGLSYLDSLQTLSLDIRHTGIAPWWRLLFSYEARIDLVKDASFDPGLSWISGDMGILVYALRLQNSGYSYSGYANDAFGAFFLVGGVSRINDYGGEGVTGVYGGVKYYKISSGGMADSLYLAFLAGKDHQLFLSRVPLRGDIFVQIKGSMSF